MKRVELKYLPLYKAFGISDLEISTLEEDEIIPELFLPEEAYKLLNVPTPQFGAPVIAFLLGREKAHYTVDWNYARALAKTGAHIRFLTYESPVSQFMGCHGLVLPGGAFASPEKFYTDPQEDDGPSPRCRAYLQLIKSAECRRIPMLGICAGAQMIGALFGLKMYRNQSYIMSDVKIEHKTKETCAHKVKILPDTPLRKIFGTNWIWTNSRHNESMVSDDSHSELKFYAFAEDGVPEAWGSEERNILCVQWHPEDEAAWGNKAMQSIYDWLAQKASAYAKK
ncbi:MAG: gamma-glutamyl-gamma-aminobutyrate hydrolase family protein [Alphaproteobacteria bacterium]|nr:gamma-glutamyl-gamma-aminobutyrate hydrolase family protein [Alphaproteobacteria bacterium]